jgi:hypothetical protein
VKPEPIDRRTVLRRTPFRRETKGDGKNVNGNVAEILSRVSLANFSKRKYFALDAWHLCV